MGYREGRGAWGRGGAVGVDYIFFFSCLSFHFFTFSRSEIDCLKGPLTQNIEPIKQIPHVKNLKWRFVVNTKRE